MQAIASSPESSCTLSNINSPYARSWPIAQFGETPTDFCAYYARIDWRTRITNFVPRRALKWVEPSNCRGLYGCFHTNQRPLPSTPAGRYGPLGRPLHSGHYAQCETMRSRARRVWHGWRIQALPDRFDGNRARHSIG